MANGHRGTTLGSLGTLLVLGTALAVSCGPTAAPEFNAPEPSEAGGEAEEPSLTAVSARPAPASYVTPTETTEGAGTKATRAVLDTIAYAEGTRERYNIIFSFQTFSSFADHPRRLICSGGYCSDAAGRYQFLSTTWDETRAALGLKSFEPLNQDKAAIDRMESFRGATEHRNPLTRSQFERMIAKLAPEWASLPGSPYGQPTKSMADVWNVYQTSLGK